MLTLDIQWLTDVARLARDPSDPTPDWPPQPDRVFSALVASWGATGASGSGRDALEWLEAQGAPEFYAAPVLAARSSVDVYVPVNDKVGDKALPERRSRQARRFAACTLAPAPAHLRFVWKASADDKTLGELTTIAKAASYVGHSASLVRLQFRNEDALGEPAGMRREAVRFAPYAGRLAELERLHERHIGGDARARPRRAPSRAPAPAMEARANVFSPEWIVLAHAGGDRPDLFAAAALARRLRDAIMGALPPPIPPWVSGHEKDGAPGLEPHLAIAPLANVGFDKSDGRLMGLAVILPDGIRSKWDDRSPDVWKQRRDFEGAIASLIDEEGSIPLRLGKAGVWRLLPDPAPTRKSLLAERYSKRSSIFQTVTPIALDKHLKKEGLEALTEAAGIITDACGNIGLPRPVRVSVFKHSAVLGAPSAWPASGSPPRPTWVRPSFLNGRRLFHARIAFEQPVDGPVILGAGRFAGLGLCLPASGADE